MFLRKNAPEIISTKAQWLNSEPLTLKKLNGKIVLLDFWTYTCINCIRTLPALRAMWAKYKDKGVVIIGIHTPEFDFEKNIRNVMSAVKKHKIEYPVLNDPEGTNWNLYGNAYWPRAELINAQGQLIFEHIGESGYDEIDKKISEELGIKQQGIAEEKRVYSPRMSPEIYAGSLRNAGLGSRMACTKKGCEYFDPGNHLENIIYLSGEWKQEPEYLEFGGGDGYISLKYYAGEVNAVMNGSGLAEVLLDEKPVDSQQAGIDIIVRTKRSYVEINRADMYNIVQSDMSGSREVKIIPFKGFRIYAYTFG